MSNSMGGVGYAGPAFKNVGGIGKKLRGDPVQDRLTFIGPNALDYTNLFERKSMWLWPGFIAPVPWAMGRRQWGQGWAAALVMWIPVFASTILPLVGLVMIFTLIWMGAGSYFGATGRTTYAMWAEEKVKTLRFDKDVKDEDYLKELEKRGGLSVLGINVGVIMMIMPIMLALSINKAFYKPPDPNDIKFDPFAGPNGGSLVSRPVATPPPENFKTTMVDIRGNPIELKNPPTELPRCEDPMLRPFISISLEKQRLPFNIEYVTNIERSGDWRGPGNPRFCKAFYRVPGNSPRLLGFYVNFNQDRIGDVALSVHRCVNCESLNFTEDMIAPVDVPSPEASPNSPQVEDSAPADSGTDDGDADPPRRPRRP